MNASDLSKLQALPVSEKLLLVDALWQSIGESMKEPTVSDAEKRELDSRWARFERDLIYKQFSRVFAKPFPYAIYFRIKDDWVVVTLLWHTAKNPEDLKIALNERDPDDQ